MTSPWPPLRDHAPGFGAAAPPGPGEGLAPARASAPAGDLRLPPEGLLSGPTLLGLAAIVGLLAIGLGSWAFASRASGTTTVTVVRPPVRSPAGVERAISLLVSQHTQRIPLAHSVGRIVLVVGVDGRAVLVVDGLGRAPAGKSYQAWVIRPSSVVPVSAAVFTGAQLVVPLKPVVARGATVAVTLERAGGARGPSHAPTLVAKRVAS